MARTRELQELVSDVRELTDTVGDPHKPQAQLNRWINQGIARLWSILVRADPRRYMKNTPATVSASSGTILYALPSDFMEVVRVSLVKGDNRITIEPYETQEYNHHFNRPTAQLSAYGRSIVKYGIIGQGLDGSEARLQLIPDPGNETYELEYVVQPQVLAQPTDTFDGVAAFEEYAVIFAARNVALKEENYELFQALSLQLREAEAHARTMGTERDSGRPRRVADLTNNGLEDWP